MHAHTKTSFVYFSLKRKANHREEKKNQRRQEQQQQDDCKEHPKQPRVRKKKESVYFPFSHNQHLAMHQHRQSVGLSNRPITDAVVVFISLFSPHNENSVCFWISFEWKTTAKPSQVKPIRQISNLNRFCCCSLHVILSMFCLRQIRHKSSNIERKNFQTRVN